MPRIPRVDFSEDVHDQLITEQGYRVNWSKALRCPCQDVRTNQPDPTCALNCQLGWLYFDVAEVRGVISQIQRTRQGQIFTEFDRGTAMITVLSTTQLGWMDRLVMIESLSRFTELITKGAAGGTDSLRYTGINIERITGLDGTVYALTTDYLLTGGAIDWSPSGVEPTTGQFYAVSYDHHPVWIVDDLVHEIRNVRRKTRVPAEVQQLMPRAAIIIKDYFMDFSP